MDVLAACHIHSTWSYDGSWTLPALAEKFTARGCRVLMTTEHDRGYSPARFAEFRKACADASSEALLVVPGIEYSDSDNRVHVLVWGPDEFLGESLPTTEMLTLAKAASGVAVLAHPMRKEVWKIFDPAWEEKLLGIEAWNRKYDGWAPSATAPALLARTQAVPFVGLDFHTENQTFPLTMAFDVHGEITESSVLESLRARRCAAQAFGKPLTELSSESALRVAESGRRTLAQVYRSAKKLVKA